MTRGAGPPSRLGGGAFLAGGLFVVAACLGYHLGGTRWPALIPVARGGPEVRVRLPGGRVRTLTLETNGPYTVHRRAGAAGEILVHADGRPGTLRISVQGGGLRLELPRGGTTVAGRLVLRGAGLRQRPSRQPIWGRLEVERAGPGRLQATCVLDMETYLLGVLVAEMGPRFPLEALKAQAVAARSYALARLRQAARQGRRPALAGTDVDQVFRPVEVVPAAIRRAVAATCGEILGTAKHPVAAYYHSTCGGATRDAAPRFDPQSPIRGRPCSYCRASPYYTWRRVFDRGWLTRVLTRSGLPITAPIRALTPTRVDGSGRTVMLAIAHGGGVTSIRATRLRRLINRAAGARRSARLLSTFLSKPTWSADGRRLIVAGRGWGHGVGLCQMGARGLARAGLTYRRILAFYYAGLPLTRAWGVHDRAEP